LAISLKQTVVPFHVQAFSTSPRSTQQIYFANEYPGY